jgi:hypothetical protein
MIFFQVVENDGLKFLVIHHYDSDFRAYESWGTAFNGLLDNLGDDEKQT